MEVGGGATSEFACVETMHLGKRTDHTGDMRGLVPLSAMRYRRKERTVRFRQQPIEGDAPGGLPQFLGLRERDDAGQRDVEAEREPGVGERGPAGEAVQD